MPASRRIPSWLLILATAAICAITWQLESADLFPVWRFAVQWSPAALPSSRAVPPSEIASGLPVLSLTLDDADLHDPERGLLPNKMKHGKEWEREASVSYFDGGRLLFASGVGVRIHGGGSRQTAPHTGMRLYFRRQYGPREVPRGVLFSPSAQPVRRLVIHDDVRLDAGMYWHFANPLAYDIARKIGAIAPETKPVRFFVNGEYYGPFVATERFDERYFGAHWGYEDVLLDQEEMDKLLDWVLHAGSLTMSTVSQRVNVENLTRWFVAVAFCATRDAYQGPGQFLDQTKKTGGWFWVNWDMDMSFRTWNLDSYQYLLERIGEGRRGRNRAEPRALVLTHLIAEDPAYREYLKRTVQDMLNHDITDAFLTERYEHYLNVATTLRAPHLEYLPALKEFLARRRAFFRLTTEQWLNTAPSQPVSILAPPQVAVLIDGRRTSNGYRGAYFPDLEVIVDIADGSRAGFSGWAVNGRMVPGTAPLRFTPKQPTVIEPMFANTPRPVEPPRPTTAAPKPTPPARFVWRDIPATPSWMGCVPNDTRCDQAERPRVETNITAPFQMMDREVSAGDFRAYASATSRVMPRQPEWYADDTHPLVNVTWDEATAYCAWAGGRLPTEAEWEHAARGGRDGQLFPWGDEFTGQAVARHRFPSETYDFTAPVGLFPPNGYGLHDMAGNVWEWTASEHWPTHATKPEPGSGLRTLKGGGWDNDIRRLRVSERAALSRQGRHNLYVGFRCIRPAQQ